MPLEDHRGSAAAFKLPRQTLVSLLVFAAVWEALSHLSPFLGIPPFAIPSSAKIARGDGGDHGASTLRLRSRG